MSKEFEHTKAKYRLNVDGYRMDFRNAAFNHKGIKFAETICDKIRFADDEDDDDILSVDIETLDELMDMMVCFKDFQLSLSQIADVKTPDGKVFLHYSSLLQNEKRNAYYENWNNIVTIEYDHTVVGVELQARIEKAVIILEGKK